ncbi:RNA polymerase sigma factor [Kutzneria buriramensis]|uniref:RNA polymerase sigma factor n=1 Tax=Kutzneria buriramensis TaxID=1045776 RepID=A0A3E0G801_9PSEU|nr:sigma-70 family RNA polymerase sigma factor [Kutzneria buriramensis]REH18126.1 RNA polymerase sigma-70 factor (ECF subfamily) [Kutzneria buriramensis]
MTTEVARGVRARSGSADNADEERALLRAIASRDEQALHDLYRRRSRELLAYLIGLCPDEQIAQELLQDTMLKVWHHAKDFRAESSVRTWLYAIARRTARDFLRASRPTSVSDERLVDEAGSRVDEPEAVVLARADAESVIAGFAALSALHREVLLLVAYRGLSVRETAQVLGIAEGTVKSRLHHARQALTAQLGVEIGSVGHEG